MMKKILSLLICVMLVMSSMATVAFADEAAAPAVIEFGEYLAKLPAGSRIIVNTGDVAEGNTVVATINGVESAVAFADGYYAVTVPAGDNKISVAVKNGDTVVAQTATISVFGLSYMGAAERKLNATFEPDSTNTVGNKLGYYDEGMKTSWYHAVTGTTGTAATTKQATIETETNGNTYYSAIGWGAATADPNYGVDGYAGVAGGNAEIVTINGGFRNVFKASVDWRADHVDVTDAEGNVVNTIAMNTPAGFVAGAKSDANSSTTRDGNILNTYMNFIDTYDYDNDGNKTENIRYSMNYWNIPTATGKPTLTLFNADGTPKKIAVDNYNTGWNNYAVVFDIPNNTAYGFINDIFVGSGCILGVQLKRTEAQEDYADNGKWVPAIATSSENTGAGKITVYGGKKATTYVHMDNLFVDVYADGFAPTEPTIAASNAIAETTLPAGTKMQITVNAVNIPSGCRAVANVNGIKTPITLVDGAYYYDAPLAAGYNNIRFEIVDANGDIAQYKGADLVSDEYAIFGLSAAGDVRVITNDTFEDDVEDDLKHVDYSTTENVEYKTAGGNTGKYIAATNAAGGGAIPIPDGTSGLGTLEFSVDMRVEGKADDQSTWAFFTGTAEGNYMNMYVLGRYTDGTTFRDQVTFFAIPRYGMEHKAVVRNADGTEKKAILESGPVSAKDTTNLTNAFEWHNYKMILDKDTNTAYLYFDGEFVLSGYIYQKAGKTVEAITSFEYANITAPRTYGSIIDPLTGAVHRVTWGFDNVYLAEIGSFAGAPTEPVVNAAITATNASLAIIPANLGLADDEAMDIAVIAKTAAGVEIQKYEDVTNESAYKAFAFDTAGIEKVFVWNWATLAPIVDAIEAE